MLKMEVYCWATGGKIVNLPDEARNGRKFSPCEGCRSSLHLEQMELIREEAGRDEVVDTCRGQELLKSVSILEHKTNNFVSPEDVHRMVTSKKWNRIGEAAHSIPHVLSCSCRCRSYSR